jgi:hypothetical protein
MISSSSTRFDNTSLTSDDLHCFVNRFAQGQTLPAAEQVLHWANCDGSVSSPALNVLDFLCFMERFARGCH